MEEIVSGLGTAYDLYQKKRKFDQVAELFAPNKRRKMTSQSINKARGGKKSSGQYGYKSKSKSSMSRIKALEKKVTAIAPEVRVKRASYAYTDWVSVGSSYRDQSVMTLLLPELGITDFQSEARLHSIHIRIPLHEHKKQSDFGKQRLLIWSYKGQSDVPNKEHPFENQSQPHSCFINREFFNIWYDEPIYNLDAGFAEANVNFRYPPKLLFNGTEKTATNDFFITFVDQDFQLESFPIFYKLKWTDN
jgi:hypothetical protein